MVRLCAIWVLLLGASASAAQIVSRRSAWNSDQSAIYTDFVIQHADGSLEVTRLPGGIVDGIGMVRFHLDLAGRAALLTPFVRTQTKSGTKLHWAKSCVFITPDVAGTTDLDGDLENQILDKALVEWTDRTRDCGYMTFEKNEPVAGEVEYGGINFLKYRQDRWSRTATDTAAVDCYSPTAAALTTLFFVDKPGSKKDGVIIDADIEINAVGFSVSADHKSNGEGSKADLQNTLTHELGHLLGLDHTCWDQSGSPLVADDGSSVPSCYPPDQLPAAVTEATMYAFEAAGETRKSSLEQDDLDGLCAIYPKDDDPGVCEPALAPASSGDGCGCRAGGAGSAGLGSLWLLSLFLLCLRR